MNPDNRQSNKTGRQRTVATCAAFVGAAIIGSVLWIMSLGKAPVIVIPTHSVPNPNALDTFAMASWNVLDATKMSYAASETHTGKDLNDRNYSLKEMDALAEENKPALALFREGIGQEFAVPPVRSMSTLFPYLSGQRNLARMLRFMAVTNEKHGEWKQAADIRIEGVAFGDKVKNRGVMLHTFVGVAVQAISLKGAFAEVEHLTASEAKDAARKLQKIIDREPAFADTLQEESYSGQAEMVEIIRNTKGYSDIHKMFLVPGSPNDASAHTQALRYIFGDKSRMVSSYRDYMAATIKNVRQPYASHPEAPTPPSDPLNEMFDPSFEGARFRDVSMKTETRMLLVAYALQAYRAEHGDYPETLEALAPGILRKTPDDLYALTGTFKYRKMGKRYVLYSVGPDGKDNGGKAILNAAAPANSTVRTQPQSDSVGDILLGTNVK